MRVSWWWEVDIDTTKTALERLARALLTVRAALSSSQYIAGWGRGCVALIVVQIPEGRVEEFLEIAKPITMCPPTLVSVGHDPLPVDGHPGRAWGRWLEKIGWENPQDEGL